MDKELNKANLEEAVKEMGKELANSSDPELSLRDAKHIELVEWGFCPPDCPARRK